MSFKNNPVKILYCLTVIILASGCNKLVQVPEPVNTITTSETFSTDANAASAVIGIYNDLTSGGGGTNFNYGNGALGYIGGLSADEMLYFNQGYPGFVQLQNNTLKYNSTIAADNFWTPAYYDIYIANAAIEGLKASATVTPAVKNQLLGEAKFLRAFVYFYLVNFFGDIPLITTAAWGKTSLLPRTPASQVYQQIIQDLQDAQGQLPGDYSVSNKERTRANKYAATALLARVYLYQKNWAGADSAASAVINNTGLFSLLPTAGLTNVFLKNSTEAIWQLAPNSSSNYATFEGTNSNTQPSPLNTGSPVYTLTHQLLAAFEPGDNRRGTWVDSTIYFGTTYYYPFKYKVQYATSSTITEYCMMLRLAEQYLIKAEAKVNEHQLNAAIADVNTIRNRAGLPNYSGSASDPAAIQAAIMHERQIEFFAEWGHRWLDLKRWGNAVSVLSANKGFTVPAYQLLYPIPAGEIGSDPNLVQNPGY